MDDEEEEDEDEKEEGQVCLHVARWDLMSVSSGLASTLSGFPWWKSFVKRSS